VRTIARLYSTAACIFLGACITAVLFALVAARLAPEWLEGLGTSVSRGIARIAGTSPAPAVADAPAAPAPASLRGEQPAAAVPAALGSAAGGGPMRAVGRPPRGRLEAEAWRAVEESLARLLDAFEDGEARLRPGAGIIAAAPGIIERLDRLTRSRLLRRAGLAESLEPRALSRILMDEDAISDARAAEILAGIEPAARAEVIDRLSRAAPERAARLLDCALGGGLPAEAPGGPRGGSEEG
jgi:hypothetical protein